MTHSYYRKESKMNFRSDSDLLKSFHKYLALKERYEEISALKKEAEKIRSKLTKQKEFSQILDAWYKLSHYGYSWPAFEEIVDTLEKISNDSIPQHKGREFLNKLLSEVDKELKNLKHEMLLTEQDFSCAFIETYENFCAKQFKKNGPFMTSVMKLPATEKFFMDFLLS